MDEKMRDQLARAFPEGKVKDKPGQGGRKMAYISHALITERLNEIDPAWSWRPIATHTYTDPKTGRVHCEGVEVELTIGGVTRAEAGGPQRQDGFTNEIKNAYSDAIKRAAMRFGVALYMWDKLVDAEYDEDVHPDYEAPAPAPDPVETLLDHIREMDEMGEPYPAIKQYATERWATLTPTQQMRVTEKMRAIQARRQPAGVAG